MNHQPCPGSSQYVAHQERVVCGALGETWRFGACPDCGQRVLIGADDRLIRHRPAGTRSAGTPVVIERRTLRERLTGGASGTSTG